MRIVYHVTDQRRVFFVDQVSLSGVFGEVDCEVGLIEVIPETQEKYYLNEKALKVVELPIPKIKKTEEE